MAPVLVPRLHQKQQIQPFDERAEGVSRFTRVYGSKLALVDAALDQRRERVAKLGKILAQQLEHRFLPARHRVELIGDGREARHRLGLARQYLGVGEDLRAHRPFALLQGTQRFHRAGEEEPQNRRDDRVFALVIQIERALAEASFRRDVVHAG